MIYYDTQLMPNSESATLFMVTNAKPFDRYEDHEAAIYIQLHLLVDLSIQSGENPIGLIEDYLEITYTDGKTVTEIADFLANTDRVQNALWSLELNWKKKDDTLREPSYLQSGISKEEATQLYTHITLRSYLEALSNYKYE